MSRIVVLVSGTGSLLQALLDAQDSAALSAQVVAVGADRAGIAGLDRAETAGVPTFVEAVGDHPDRAAWDRALATQVTAHRPDLVITAGFMKILGPATLATAPVLNTHPALLPAFPGAHGVRDALAYGVKVTGSTAHLVDEGMDTGPIIDQRVVPIAEDDTEDSLHERIKVLEREMLVEVAADLLVRGFTVDGRRVVLGPA
mgnify:CR=1 FL=1